MRRHLLFVLTFAGGLLLGASASTFLRAGEAPSAFLRTGQAPSASPRTGEPRSAAAAKPVTGIGGVFLRAHSPEALREWYRQHLGLEAGPGGTQFLWRPADDPGRVGRTVWSVFPEDTEYFGAAGQQCMVNYIVDDLDAVLARLEQAGIRSVKEPEAYPYGRFAWVEDGEGNRIELWEPSS